jgi:hypothetical protein
MTSSPARTASPIRIHRFIPSMFPCEAEQRLRHFYESFFDMCQGTIPFGDGYDAWERERDQAMRNGREFWDCGVPPDGRR